MTTQSPTFSIGSYDVLMLSSDKDDRIRQQFASKDHIGNHRFQVFLQMHRDAYQHAERCSDEIRCVKIAENIIDVICNQCSPKGRFLQKIGMSNEGVEEWRDLGTGAAARELVRRSLRNPPLMGNGHTVMPCELNFDAVDRCDLQLSIGHSKDVAASDLALPLAPPAQVENNRGTVNDDANRKRRRHSSLLRRSFSEPGEALVSRRTSMGTMKPCRRRFLSSCPGVPQSEVADSDVLCKNDTVLSTDNIGNNRFRVMVEMNRKQFAESEMFGKSRIVSNIVCSVRGGAFPGRFLEEDKTGLYQELSYMAATKLVMTVLQAATDDDLSKLRTAALQSLKLKKQRRHINNKIRSRPIVNQTFEYFLMQSEQLIPTRQNIDESSEI